MSKQEIEMKICNLTDSVEKAKFMIESAMENCDLDNGDIKDTKEAIKFACHKKELFYYASVINDYLLKALEHIAILEEGAY